MHDRDMKLCNKRMALFRNTPESPSKKKYPKSMFLHMFWYFFESFFVEGCLLGPFMQIDAYRVLAWAWAWTRPATWPCLSKKSEICFQTRIIK